MQWHSEFFMHDLSVQIFSQANNVFWCPSLMERKQATQGSVHTSKVWNTEHRHKHKLQHMQMIFSESLQQLTVVTH